MANYSAIFIGGGNTFKLLKGIKDRGAFSKLKDFINNNGIIFGGSAGAIILCALPEEDTIFINGENIEVIGNRPYYVFKNGERKEENI